MEHHGHLIDRKFIFLIDQLRDPKKLHFFHLVKSVCPGIHDWELFQLCDVALHDFVVNDAQAVA